jgi:uncharacterized repeat protein (TIGR01451 family)
MKNIFKKAILGLSLALAAVTFVKAQTVDPANPYAFEKKAYKPDGTPWVGPVNVGEIIKYVLSYKPGAAPSGPVTIDDTLSPNLSYVAPTVGPGWTWGSAPYSTGNHEQYQHPGFGPGNATVLVTAGPPSNPVAGKGDGTIPIPILSLSKVFSIFHHAQSLSEGKIDCWDIVSLAKCGVAQPNATTDYLRTPRTPLAVVRGKFIFFPGFRSDNTATFGCFDGAANTACPDTPVPATVPQLGAIGGLVEDGAGRIFMTVMDKVFCMTESSGTLTPCSGWPSAGLQSVTSALSPNYGVENEVYMLAEFSPNPSKIYIHHSNAIIQCVDTNTASICSTWPAAGVQITGGSKGLMLSSIPSGQTGDGGVCLWPATGGAPIGCVDNNGQEVPISLPTYGGGFTLATLRIPGTNKLFFGNTPVPKCWEFVGTNATACSGITAVLPPVPAGQYGFAMDPSKPDTCVLALGDANIMWRFDYVTGVINCGTQIGKTPPIESLYCNAKPDPNKFKWTGFTVPTASANGTVTIMQGTTTVYSGVVVANGSYVFTTPPNGSAPLTISFASSSGSPVNIDLALSYSSDVDPEICYQAKVEKCGPVFNDAVFKGSYNGSAVNVPKKVDLGQASGPNCSPPPPPPPSCLSGKADVTCGKVQGTYNIIIHPNGVGGVIPTSVTITPITPGITLSPARMNYPVIGGQVQVTVVGAHLGDVLEFDVSGTTAGGGSASGSDLCCNGKIKIEIPKDLPCKDLIPVDLAIKKTGGTTPAPDVPAYAFHLTVTNEGPAYTAAPGALMVTDVVPAGMVFNSVTGTGWTCLPSTNVPAGVTVTCHNTVAMNLAAGPAAPVGVIDITATALGNAPFPDFTNCGKVGLDSASGAADTVPQNNRSCVTVSKNPKKSEIKINKICDPVTEVIGAINHFEAKCHITVTSTGPQSGTIVVSEAMTGGTVLSATAPAPWNCTTANCNINGTLLNQTSSSTVIDIVVKINQGEKAARNCARLSQTNANPIESCVDIPSDPKKPVDLKIEKTGAAECFPNAPCTFTVTLTSIGQPYNGNVVLADAITPSVAWPVISIAPNVCGASIGLTPFACVANMNLAADVPFSFTVTLQSPNPVALQNENCITVAAVGSGTSVGELTPAEIQDLKNKGLFISKPVQSCWRFTEPPVDTQSSQTIKKVCDPATEVIGAINRFEAKCHITVTTTGPQTGTVSFGEALTGNGTITSIASTATPAWTCMPTGCNIAGSALNQTSSTSNIDVTVSFPNGGSVVEGKNCAQMTANQVPFGAPSCAPFTKSNSAFTMNVTKTCDAFTMLTATGPWVGQCHITVTTSGGPLPPYIDVTESLQSSNTSNPNGPAATTGFQSSDPWVCTNVGSGAPANTPLHCVIAGSGFPASGTSVINVNVYVPIGTVSGEVQNCATAAANQTPQQPAVPAMVSNQSCVPLPGGPKPPVDSDMYIKKIVVNHAPLPLTGMVYDITSQCTNSTQPTGFAHFVDGQTVLFHHYEAGMTCNLSEQIPATTACGKDTPVWSTTYSQQNPVVLSPNGETVTVTNTLNCKPIDPPASNPIKVKKVVINNAPAPVGDLQFPITVTCVKGNNGEVLDNDATHTVADGQTVDYLPYAAGFTCSAHEGTIPPTNACGKQTPVWTTAYATQPLLMTPAGETIMVTNTLNCKPQVIDEATGPILVPDVAVEPGIDVVKHVINNTGAVLPDMEFAFGIDCSGKTPGGILISDGQTVHVPLPANMGNCEVKEGDPTSATSAGVCPVGMVPSWATSYSPSAVVSSTNGSTVIITNTVHCEPAPPPKPLLIKKVVVNNAPNAIGDIDYDFNIQCPSLPMHSIFLKNGETKEAFQYIPGAVCSITEGGVASPTDGYYPRATDACGFLHRAKWTVSFSVPSTGGGYPTANGFPTANVTMVPGGQTITVTNTLDCEFGIYKAAQCDPATTNKEGDSCVCKFPNMTQVSPLACGCAAGSNLAAGQGCIKQEPAPQPIVTEPPVKVDIPPVIITPPKPPVLNCDERTTKLVNGQCRCIIQGQTPISKTACGCPKGTELQKGQCVKPKPVCPQGTRFNDGRKRCEPICRDGQEYNASRNVCLTPKPVCRQGTHYNPATNSCVIDKPVCKRGQKYDAATNRCINVRPVCEPGTQYNPKRNTCVPVEQRCPGGTIKVRGQCIEIPRCRFPQIPVPGTGICVNPFGGGGKPPPRTDGGAVPGL